MAYEWQTVRSRKFKSYSEDKKTYIYQKIAYEKHQNYDYEKALAHNARILKRCNTSFTGNEIVEEPKQQVKPTIAKPVKVVRRVWLRKDRNQPLLKPECQTRGKQEQPEIVARDVDVGKLAKILIEQSKAYHIPCYIIGKRKYKETRITSRNMNGKTYLKLETNHEMGSLKRTDVHIQKSVEPLIRSVLKHYDTMDEGMLSMITHGHSGLTYMNMEDQKLMVVRGRYMDRLINACEPFTGDLKRIKHYTSQQQADEFWESFTNYYVRQRREAHDHTIHEATMSLSECGRRASIYENVFSQSFKITCGLCAKTYGDATDDEILQRIHNAIQRAEDLNRLFISSCPSLKHSLRVIKQCTNVTTEHHRQCLEVVKTLDPTMPTPANRIVEIATDLMKLQIHDSNLASSIGNNLVEIAKWYAKKYRQNKEETLENYKNKVPPRGVVGNALMCDNQLDNNGNFLWGQRAYHAKRFLSNFYNKVDSSDGYDKHIIRHSPNTQRHLAIGKLIVVMDLEQMRDRMRGLPLEPLQITQACVSRINGNIVYPCSCVTQESGKPLWSELIMPTKEHISLGNTADPHLVDLPQTDPPQMYIVKDGYCYLNIFLAMLIYVNENMAKDFTKFIRDRIQPMLGEWPKLKDVATACYLTATFYPDTLQAEIPKILVDHRSKTVHVLDTFGSLTTNYHILKANTVAQLVRFAYNDLKSEMKEYIVGGNYVDKPVVKLIECLIKGIFHQKKFQAIIEEEPFLILLAIESPCVLINMYNNGNFEMAMKYYVTRNMPLANLLSLMEGFAKKVSMADILVEQLNILEDAAYTIHAHMAGTYVNDPLARYVKHHLLVMMNRSEMNAELRKNGHTISDARTFELIEKKYIDDVTAAWNELSLCGKLRVIQRSYLHRNGKRQCLKPKISADLGGIYSISPSHLVSESRAKTHKLVNCISTKLHHAYSTAKHVVKGKMFKTAYNLLPDSLKLMNVFIILSAVSTIIYSIIATGTEYQKYKREKYLLQIEREEELVEMLHKQCTDANNRSITRAEFLEYVSNKHPRLLERATSMTMIEVEHQKKSANCFQLEQAIALATLVTMLYDYEKSDAVYKILQKIKTCTSILSTEVEHQGIQVDQPQDLNKLKNLTVDFEINQEIPPTLATHDTTFEKWWSLQITQGRTTTHYRNKGEFIQFTRDNAVAQCNRVAHTAGIKHFLIKGNVGSGKSTGIPKYLSEKGKVLVLEPTRPLTENVYQQLRAEPWCLDPTMQMRGKSMFGSTPITIMTTGFALHLFANNVDRLREYDFIMFDECHVIDASAMAFYCLLEEYKYNGKILSVSATPPGRESEFETEKPVELRIFEDVSFENFVNEQGTGSKLDALSVCDSVLIYVASYNEVDYLSRLLNEKGLSVTKVDGRTINGTGNMNTNLDSKTKPSISQVLQEKLKDNSKHFIVATNIIENGVTLNVDGVVDFGMKVVADLDVDNRAITYNKVPISYGERVQRLGRVGRFKAGYAFRIGRTQKGISEIPAMTATEAAFLCFAYGLPVITHNVSTTHLSNVTNLQARTMLQFELPIFMMSELVKFDGHMHPAIHKILKPFKLRDSSINLRETALPQNAGDVWLNVESYKKLGHKLTIPDGYKIPYLVNGVSDKLYMQIWEAVHMFRSTCCMKRMTSSCAGKVAYTLQTDIHAVPRTLAIIDGLIKDEQTKHSHFLSIATNSTSSYNFTLNGIVDMLKSRYMRDHSVENIQKLEMVKNQIIEFSNANMSLSDVESIRNFGALQTVIHEGKNQIIEEMDLKGIWKKDLMCKDGIIAAGVAIGGILIGYECFKHYFMTSVEHQAKTKRSKQKMRFRDARDRKMGHTVYNDDGVIDQQFSREYDRKEKKGNKAKVQNEKNRRFTHVYGFDPTEYNMIRFVDPLTGVTLDESMQADMKLVNEHFADIREQMVNNDELERQALYAKPGLHAYFIKNSTLPALKVDLTAHNPNQVCRNHIEAGFKEFENELRQTGPAIEVPASYIPKPKVEGFEHEGLSAMRGVANYNPIADNICMLRNESDGHTSEMFGIGYGPFIVAPSHLFERNNGTLCIRSTRGLYKIMNTSTLKLAPVSGRDIIVIRLPKDHPPFTQSIKFEEPDSLDRVIMIKMNFQTNRNIMEVSESSIISKQNETFWKHWIATQAGYCGLPLVNTRTKAVNGIHSLRATNDEVNYFTSINREFLDIINGDIESVQWVKKWKYNTSLLSWSGLHIKSSKPSAAFRTSKQVEVIEERLDSEAQHSWLSNRFNENLIVTGYLPGKLVTKHVVKGRCALFNLYLQVDEAANKFFSPLLGRYGKSLLNREAFIKDFTKYDKPIIIGNVQTHKFEIAIRDVVNILHRLGIKDCNYVNKCDEIMNSLNMKAAVGALYGGKKKDYFSNMTDEDKEELLKLSCKRLYKGELGIWNGSLKAELRPVEKILANKTRTFTAAPIETLLGGKVCVDDFNNQFYANHLNGPWTVGISKFHKGWDRLLKALPDDWIYCDADGSQYDSSLSPYLLNAVLDIRIQCMENWQLGESMLRNLYTEIVYTPIATPDGSVVKKFKGNNSGQPSTVVDNTIMLILAFTYSLRVQGVDSSDQDDIIRMYGNGDDLLIAVNPSFEHLLDSMGEHFTNLGLNFDFSSRTRNKEDLWFMSHRGMLRDGVYIPKLEMERIVAILEWDRSVEPEHRLSAICAAIIEAWGYDELTYEVRRFYQWVLEQEPYKELAANGKAPYLSESALRKLYLDEKVGSSELLEYYDAVYKSILDDCAEHITVEHQSQEDAGKPAGGTPASGGTPNSGDNTNTGSGGNPNTGTGGNAPAGTGQNPPAATGGGTPAGGTPAAGDGNNNQNSGNNNNQNSGNRNTGGSENAADKDVDASSLGTYKIPRLQNISKKIRVPTVSGKSIIEAKHLIKYKPDQRDISNARATQDQFKYWYEQIKKEYEVTDDQMKILMNGFMVWAIENGTSPDINGYWTMMDGDTQVSYPLKTIVENAKPTLRQCMMHFSDLAEAYIEWRNMEQPYMPRYGTLRNLNDKSLARFAFDFYEVHSKTPNRAREAHAQMKAAAIRGATNNMFGLDGNVGETSENTERHTATDVSRNVHSYRGARMH